MSEEKGKSPNDSQRDQELDDLRILLGLPAGQRFLRRLIYRLAHINALSYSDSERGPFNEGERNVGLNVYADCLQADAALTFQLQEVKEHGNR